MAKSKSMFVCQNCEATYPTWQGQCTQCGEWNTLVEQVVEKSSKIAGRGGKSIDPSAYSISYPEVEALSESKSRLSSTIGELDRVLGGDEGAQGIVPGAVVLIGGEPGVGKSTILTQMVVGMLQVQVKPEPIIYIAGEESPSQISLRVERITEGLAKQKKQQLKDALKNLIFLTTTNVDEIDAAIQKLKPSIVVVDSIQTITTDELTGAAGSIGQIREVTDRLTTTAKAFSIPMFLVGHVTKEGKISGPKVLEHIVDAVLELSGERTGELRLIRAVKNRFGATDEVGVFRVTGFGYESVTDPTSIFIEHMDEPVPGSSTVVVLEGTRPLLIETQALVIESQLAMPRRVGRGIQLSRIQVLSAVLQKHCGLPLGSADIFLSVAGGYEVREPAVDLGLAVAVASSLKNVALPKQTCFIGEVGLLGEVRSVPMLERRIKEAKRLGFEHIISKKTHNNVREVLSKFKLLK